MNGEESQFRIPRNIERYLAAQSKLYAHEQNRLLQELIVNGHPAIHECYSSWNNEVGHLLHLSIPEPLYLRIIHDRIAIQTQIKDDLNKIHNVQNEFIEEVFIEMEVGEDHDWRNDSGLLLAGQKVISPHAATQIWGEGSFRVFLSHKSEVKKETAGLKEQLRQFGISCFVAHDDIEPTKEWQDEIENALASMDGFVALLTENFHDSNWTDQEVGFAFARGVPIIAVRLGKDPYGFIGKFQGLATSWGDAAGGIMKLLLKNERALSAYLDAVKNCPSWDAGNTLGTALPSLKSLSSSQIDELVKNYNENRELRGSFAFNGTKRNIYGEGLVFHLNRLGTRKFEYVVDKKIKLVADV